jgi:hypothetical protein
MNVVSHDAQLEARTRACRFGLTGQAGAPGGKDRANESRKNFSHNDPVFAQDLKDLLIVPDYF